VIGLQPLQRTRHAGGHFDLAGAQAARDLEADYRLAVQQRQAAPLGHRVGHGGDLVEPHAAAVGQDDVEGRDLGGRLHGANGAHRLLGPAQIGAAAAGLLLHLAQLPRDVGRGGVQGEQPGGVELHPHLARDTAHARHGAHAAHLQQAARHRVVDEPRQLLLVHAGRGQRVGQDRRAGEVDALDDGVAQVGRQIGAHAGHRVAHFVDRFLDRLFQAELGGDGADTVLALGIDVLDALDGGDRVLDAPGDLRLHLRRCGAGQLCGDGDGGQLDVGELLDLHRLERADADQRQQHEQQHRRQRIADRPGGNVDGHGAAPPTCGPARLPERTPGRPPGPAGHRPRGPGRRRRGSPRRWPPRASAGSVPR
jgi:hypothetical protein